MAKITVLNVAFESAQFYPGGKGGGEEKCGMERARGSADHLERRGCVPLVCLLQIKWIKCICDVRIFLKHCD